MKKQELPAWFNGEKYEEGDTVRNRFSGEEFELNNVELSMYDFVMGAQVMLEMGMAKTEAVSDMKKGLEWFKENNNAAYLALLE